MKKYMMDLNIQESFQYEKYGWMHNILSRAKTFVFQNLVKFLNIIEEGVWGQNDRLPF